MYLRAVHDAEKGKARARQRHRDLWSNLRIHSSPSRLSCKQPVRASNINCELLIEYLWV